MDEFERIRIFFAPLAGRPAGAKFGDAFGLTDDAARITPDSDLDIVVTKDLIVEGVHFLQSDPPERIARKRMRVNLSDLAAKGAGARGCVLGCAWPESWTDGMVERFAQGLHTDQEIYDVQVLGGDTVSTPGPLVCSLTMLGTVPKDRMVLRSGARPGDAVFVTGTIGDACAGLKILRLHADGAEPDPEHEYVRDRYQLPQPRTALAPHLPGLATAAIDVSDGLAADAGHIARASGVTIDIQISDVPVSRAARAVEDNRVTLITGGDDYEILFTAPRSKRDRIAALAQETGIAITEIGAVSQGTGLRILDTDGTLVPIMRPGYRHS